MLDADRRVLGIEELAELQGPVAPVALSNYLVSRGPVLVFSAANSDVVRWRWVQATARLAVERGQLPPRRHVSKTEGALTRQAG